MHSSQAQAQLATMLHTTAAGAAAFAVSVLTTRWRQHIRSSNARRDLRTSVRLHGKEHSVRIVYCVHDDEDAIAQLCDQAEKEGVVGLDCEWRPETKGTHSKTALLQISAGDLVFVQRILHRDALHSRLQALLADTAIVKVGLHVRTDAARLLCDTNAVVRNTVDLKDVFTDAGLLDGISLAGMAQRLLQVSLDKRHQRSDWACDYLSDDQLSYAAMDAWISPRLLRQVWSTSSPTHEGAGDMLAFAKSYRRDIDHDRVLLKQANRKRKNRAKEAAKLPPSAEDESRPEEDADDDSPSGAPDKRSDRPIRHAVRKTALYENCRIQAPDGYVLCTCSKKKLIWYLERGLAEVVELKDGEPNVVRLKFEPSGRGAYDDDFYLGEKHNCCCICGGDDQYLRHHVVPYTYRQHFPTTMKSHLSHDVVLTCLPCHRECSRADQKRMQLLATQYGVPLAGLNGDKMIADPAAAKAKSSAKTLRRATQGNGIPEERLEYHRSVLRSYFGLDDSAPITAEHTKTAFNLVVKKQSDAWLPHGQAVVNRIIETGGFDLLEEFIRDWRRHFLAELSPRFMQPFWSVDNRVHNSRHGRIDSAQGAVSQCESQPQHQLHQSI